MRRTVEQQPCAIFTNAKTANEIGDQFLTYNDEADCKRFLKDNCLVLGFNEEELHSKMAMITLYDNFDLKIVYYSHYSINFDNSRQDL